MPSTFNLAADSKPVELLNPATDAAGRTGLWVNAKNYAKLFLVAHINQANAATILLSVNQATSSAGGGSKVITTAVPIYSNLDTSVNDTLVSRTAAVNYTTDAGLKNKMVIFEIDPVLLDVQNSFTWVTLVTGASNLANITQAIAYAVGSRFHQVGLPSAVVA